MERWVDKVYFPVEKCLKVCQEEGNALGEAVLTKRSGRPHDAIGVYTKILTNFPALGLLEQIKLLYRDSPNFLSNLVDEADEENYLLSFERGETSYDTFALQ